MRRGPEEAADDVPRLLDDNECGIEAVEARLGAKPPEQAEHEVVLGLVRLQERPGERDERVGFVDAYRTHRQGAASRWPPSTGRTIPVTKEFVRTSQISRRQVVGRSDASCGKGAREPVEHCRTILGGHAVPGGSSDDARRDGVDANRRQLDRKGADERLEGAVHGGRCGAAAHRRRSGDTRDEDDRLAYLSSLDGRERSPELGLEGLPGGFRDRATWPALRPVRQVRGRGDRPGRAS